MNTETPANRKVPIIARRAAENIRSGVAEPGCATSAPATPARFPRADDLGRQYDVARRCVRNASTFFSPSLFPRPLFGLAGRAPSLPVLISRSFAGSSPLSRSSTRVFDFRGGCAKANPFQSRTVSITEGCVTGSFFVRRSPPSRFFNLFTRVRIDVQVPSWARAVEHESNDQNGREDNPKQSAVHGWPCFAFR